MKTQIRLHQLECFRALARTGSFERAAKFLGITASAVHQHIANLHDCLERDPFFGDKLYEVVDGHHLKITPYGNDVLLLAEAVLRPIEEFGKESPHRREEVIVNVASLGSVTTYVLPGIIGTLQRNYPDISVKIISRTHAEILSLVSGGYVDVGITQEENMPEDLLFREWRRVDTVLMVPFNHPFLTKSAISLKMLAGEPLILPRALSPASSRIRDILCHAGIDKAVVEVTGYESAKQCVAVGLGIALASGIVITGEDRKKFHVIPMSNIVGEYVYGVVLRKKQSLLTPLKFLLGAMGIEFNGRNVQ